LGSRRDRRSKKPQAPDVSNLLGSGGFGGMRRDAFQANMERQSRYKGVSAMINDLPEDGQWTKDQRASGRPQRWLKALTAAVDYEVEIVPREDLVQ
jgi:hypothetical protein